MDLFGKDRRRALLQPDSRQCAGAGAEGRHEGRAAPAVPGDRRSAEAVCGAADSGPQSNCAMAEAHGLCGDADIPPSNAIRESE